MAKHCSADVTHIFLPMLLLQDVLFLLKSKELNYKQHAQNSAQRNHEIKNVAEG